MSNGSSTLERQGKEEREGGEDIGEGKKRGGGGGGKKHSSVLVGVCA